MLSKACVLWIEFPPISLSGQGWCSTFRQRLLWEACAEGVASITDMPIVVASPVGTKIAAVCSKTGWQHVVTSHSSQIPSIVEAVEALDIRRLVTLHPLLGLGLVPVSFLKRVVCHHEQRGAMATLAVDLPSPLHAVVLEREMMAVIKDSASRYPLHYDLYSVIRAIGHQRREQSLMNGAVEYVSFAKECSVATGQVPSTIPWSSQRDREVLDSALAPEVWADPLGNLRRLRQITVDRLDAGSRPQRLRPSRRAVRKVLFASTPSAYSGAEECLINTMSAVSAQGVECHCLIGVEGLFSERARQAGAIVHCPNGDWSVANVENVLWIEGEIERIRPDVVHCNAIVGVPLLAVSRLRRIPLAQWVRVPTVEALLDHLIAADLITAVSQFIGQQVTKQMVKPEKVQVLYDGVDTGRFSPSSCSQEVRREFCIEPDEFVILCIARFVPRKRHDVLIRAVSTLCRTCPGIKIRLMLVGDRERDGAACYESTQALIDHCGIRHITTTLPFQADVLGLESVADVVVLPSDDEPLGTVVLESMSLARPVIVSAAGGLTEMVADGESGLHFRQGDPEALTRQISSIVSNPEFGVRLGVAARNRVIEKFSMDAHSSRLLGLYNTILEQAAMSS